MKGLYKQAGVANKPTVFLFDETQIVHESFLEDVNNILSSGEVRCRGAWVAATAVLRMCMGGCVVVNVHVHGWPQQLLKAFEVGL